jgi:DNA-binding response OmpR family regulator
VNPATVLVVDDDRVLVDALASWLEAEGFEVRRAYDGLQGLADARRTNPDLVLADVSMPGLNGVHLAARLREQGIPIVLLSANDAPWDMDPATPFFAKPFDIEEIYQVIVTTIADHQATNARSNGR